MTKNIQIFKHALCLLGLSRAKSHLHLFFKIHLSLILMKNHEIIKNVSLDQKILRISDDFQYILSNILPIS